MSVFPISVIVPVASNETQHDQLALQLPDNAEVILARGGTRAESLNRGAAASTREFLWFLHADSRFDSKALGALLEATQKHPKAVLYFDLSFSGPPAPLMALNALGVRFRSRLLGLPFGDQGLCVHRDVFAFLGGFPTDFTAGEDHIFVWRAHRAGVAVLPVGAILATDARKYRRGGWLRTTLHHLVLTVKQAWPEWRAYRREKKSRRH